ncbi:MAG: SDR family oxidoreductase [Kordiimonas sp.]
MIGTGRKTALITGAARRIGKHLAIELASQGITVAVHHNGSEDEAAEVVDSIKTAGGNAFAVQADLSSEKETNNLIAETTKILDEPIGILINNASVFQQDTLSTLTASSWDLHHNVNLRAPVLLTQAFAKQLPRSEQGIVINMIDQRVFKLNPQYMSYTASKAGLLAVTKTMAQALAPNGIRVNGIGPGPTLANEHQSAEDFASEAACVPLGSGPSLDEIAACVRFILETPSLTGQMIALDGGQHLAWRTKDILED